MDVLVFGSAIVDFICYVPRLPNVGETLHGKKFATGFGGKGANQCVAASRLGAKAAIIAKLGDDDWGQNYKNNLKTENINTEFVDVVQNETTGIAQISVADNGNNQIIIVTGANQLLSEQDVKRASALFTTSKVLVCQLETPIDATIAAIKAFKGISILNAAPALPDTPKELLKYSTILCINETEAALMINGSVETIDDAKNALEKIITMGANTVIITLGAQGAIYSEKCERKPIHVTVRKVDNVVDTTGAGDAFIGALAYFLALKPEKPLHQQIGAACEIAAKSVENLGTQSSFPSAKDLNFDFDLLNFEWFFI